MWGRCKCGWVWRVTVGVECGVRRETCGGWGWGLEMQDKYRDGVVCGRAGVTCCSRASGRSSEIDPSVGGSGASGGRPGTVSELITERRCGSWNSGGCKSPLSTSAQKWRIASPRLTGSAHTSSLPTSLPPSLPSVSMTTDTPPRSPPPLTAHRLISRFEKISEGAREPT